MPILTSVEGHTFIRIYVSYIYNKTSEFLPSDLFVVTSNGASETSSLIKMTSNCLQTVSTRFDLNPEKDIL